MSRHHVETWLWWSQAHQRQIFVGSRSSSIEIERVPRHEMHAHVLASPSSAEEPRKPLTMMNAYRDKEAEGSRLA